MSDSDFLFELYKISLISDGTRRSLAEIQQRLNKTVDIFGFKFYPRIL